MPWHVRFRTGPFVYTSRGGKRTVSGFWTFVGLLYGAAAVVVVVMLIARAF